MSGRWMLAPLGVAEEAFEVPNGYRVLDPETLEAEADMARTINSKLTVEGEQE
ncbi:MAG: hypothetical protein L0L76_10400 [Yaniella sp.]|uniref:hypothetical protein n=1 Tax=Yaniella sp. TaxID=2773929 RepID=UPI00264A37AA|nr:hypothetical protein [Yaniella sp.]MDN6758999.1 hypothetical protein [Yaniella sp.]